MTWRRTCRVYCLPPLPLRDGDWRCEQVSYQLAAYGASGFMGRANLTELLVSAGYQTGRSIRRLGARGQRRAR